jgi:Holliday junction DNA helicase RuvA
VGKRTAERLAVELRTRLQERYGSEANPEDTADLALPASGSAEALPSAVRDEVNLTLTALGYEALEINRALRAVATTEEDLGQGADAWLRECLRWLSRSQAA